MFNPFDFINGAIFRPEDNTLSTVRFRLGNSTQTRYEVVASKVITSEPKLIRSFKTKGISKVMIYNSAADEIQIYSEDLNKQEHNIQLNLQDDTLIDV